MLPNNITAWVWTGNRIKHWHVSFTAERWWDQPVLLRLMQLQSRTMSFPLQDHRTGLLFSSARVWKKLSHFLSVAAFMSSQDVQVAQCWGVIGRCALKDDVPVKSKEEEGQNISQLIQGASIKHSQRNAELAQGSWFSLAYNLILVCWRQALHNSLQIDIFDTLTVFILHLLYSIQFSTIWELTTK